MKKINEITPYVFENHLLISLAYEFVRMFDEIPEFNVFVDSKNYLVIKSKKPMKEYTNGK